MLPKYLADRIRDAAFWYGLSSRHGTPSTALRSPELKPSFSLYAVFKMCQSAESVAKYQAALVGELCLRRSVCLQDRPADYQTMPAAAVSGRILLIDTFSSTYDGLAADASDGFFDDSDCPPWDSWIDYEISVMGSSTRRIRGLLSAWIPEEFFTIVEEAIVVCGGEALSWGSEEHVGFDAATIESFVEELERTVSAA